MARPREFDESALLDAAIRCFWPRGYEATSVKDLTGETGLAAASLYNAYGDKRTLYRAALDRYVAIGVADRIARCEKMAPRRAIGAFFDEIVRNSLGDRERKGCMLVNSALEMAPHDPAFRDIIAGVFARIETFFRARIEAGQEDGTIAPDLSAAAYARHLLGILMGVRVLARVMPEAAVLRDVLDPALARLAPPRRTRKAKR